VRVVEVPLACSSLNEGDVFVLDNGLTLWQWQGKLCNQAERVRAQQLCRQIADERNGRPKCKTLDQNDKDPNEDFWALMGGKGEIPHDQGGDEDWETKEEKALFQLSDAGGKLEFNKVAESNRVTRDKLDSKEVFIFDIGVQLFIWIGKGASEGEKKEAMVVATKYLVEHKRPNWLPITRIPEGGESTYFESQFTPQSSGYTLKKAQPSTSASSGGAGGGCYLSYVEASNGSLFLTWSKTGIQGALAMFSSGKPVADHKYKSNGGREELTRGTDSTPKNLYQGWCNFLKLSREYNGTVTVFTKDVQVSVHDDANRIIMINAGDAFEVYTNTQPAVAAWQRSRALFEGAVTTGRDHFLNTAQTDPSAAAASREHKGAPKKGKWCRPILPLLLLRLKSTKATGAALLLPKK